jgi:hypothetical protein
MNYQKIKKKCGRIASWAVWNPEDIADTSIIEKYRKDLNPDIVMVGLNISGPLDADWKNFHSRYRGSNDRKLMKAFNESPFRGAYMTDFIKGVAEPKSVLVKKYLKTPYLKRHKKEFIDELKFIGAKDPLIIIFGADSSLFVKTFKSLFCNTYCIKNIPHYSSWMSDSQWIKTALNILKN